MSGSRTRVAGGPPRRQGVAVAAGVAIAVAVVAVAAAGHRFGAPQTRGLGWIDGPQVGWVAAIALLALAVAAAWWSDWDRPVLVAFGGVVLVVAGSGIGRPFGERTFHGRGGGPIYAVTSTWWPVVGLGLALVVGALVAAAVVRDATNGRRTPALVALATEAVGVILIVATMGDVVVGHWIEGRPRRRRGRRVRRAEVQAGPQGEPGDRPRSVEGLWARAAVDEAEAIAAFTDLAARLAAVGAPDDLVVRSRRAARDEVRHARACRRFAGVEPLLDHWRSSTQYRHDGDRDAARGDASVNPTRRSQVDTGAVRRDETEPTASRATSTRRVELVRLAVESCVDGVIGEGAAAGRLELGAATCPRRAPVLVAMAREEREHAALAADIVRWCVAESPRLVRPAVLAITRRVPAHIPFPESHLGLADDALRDAGLVDRPGAERVWRAERAAAAMLLDDLTRPGSRTSSRRRRLEP